MATNDIIENPVTGERMRWLVTSAETDGRYVRAEWWARPGGGVRFEHIHRVSDESFEVLAGCLSGTLDGRPFAVGPGEQRTLPAQVPHTWFNAGDEDVHFVLEISPAGHFEETIETFFGLAREGRVKPDGMPGLLQMAVMVRAFGFEAYPTRPPLALLRAAAIVLAPIARLAGRRPSYRRFTSAAPQQAALV